MASWFAELLPWWCPRCAAELSWVAPTAAGTTAGHTASVVVTLLWLKVDNKSLKTVSRARMVIDNYSFLLEQIFVVIPLLSKIFAVKLICLWNKSGLTKLGLVICINVVWIVTLCVFWNVTLQSKWGNIQEVLLAPSSQLLLVVFKLSGHREYKIELSSHLA